MRASTPSVSCSHLRSWRSTSNIATTTLSRAVASAPESCCAKQGCAVRLREPLPSCAAARAGLKPLSACEELPKRRAEG